MSAAHRRARRLPAFAAVLLATTVAGCGTGTAATDPPLPAPIRIAIINPQTGQFSSLGKWEHKGVKLAVDEANAAGGVNGRPIELSVFDDEGVAATAAALTDKVAAAGYVAIFGSALSGNTLAMAPSLARSHIPAMTSGQAPSLSELGNPFVFLNCATSATFDETLAEHVIATMGVTSIAMITNESAYGKGERTAFRSALASRGVTPQADVVVAVGQKDFTTALAQIQRLSPAALFIGAEEIQSGLIAQQARAMGIPSMFIGGAPMGTDVFVNTAGAEAVNGSIFSTPYPTNDENEATRAFARAYQAAFGEAPEFHGAKAYDGARIVIHALRNTNGAGGAQLAEAIRAVKFHGLLGDFDYDATGVGLRLTRVATIEGGTVAAIAS